MTLARKSSQRVPKHLGGIIHDVGLPVADVERRTRFRRMQILAVRVGLAYLLRLPRLRAMPATSALRVSSPSVDPGARTIVEDNIGGFIQQQSGLSPADVNRSNSKGECEHSPPSNGPWEGLSMQEWRGGG